MGDVGDYWRDVKTDFKKESQIKRMRNNVSSIEILDRKKIPYKKFTSDHYRVGEFDFWPSTGLFIHIKTKARGRGVFNLIKKVSICSDQTVKS